MTSPSPPEPSSHEHSVWQVRDTEPRLAPPPGCASLLAGRVMVHARPRLVAGALNKGADLTRLIDVAHSGLMLCGSNAAGVLTRCRDSGFDGPLAIDPAAYEVAAATVDRPFALDGEDALFGLTLGQALDAQRGKGADVALTPTKFMQAGDRAALKAACRAVAEVDRNDTLFCVPLHIAWFNDTYIGPLIAILQRVPPSLPKAVFLGSQLDPLDFVERAVPNLRRLVGEVANVAVLRTDFAAFDVTAHGALAASIGTGGSLRHIVPPDESAESQIPPTDRSPTVLFPDLIHFFRGTTLARRFANAKAPVCTCGACGSRRLDTFLGDRDRFAAYCHNIRSWMDWLPDLSGHTSQAERVRWWRGKCKAAVDNHDIYNQQLRQRNAFKPPKALAVWAEAAGSAAA